MAIRFNEKDIRITGRSAMGVRGMRVNEDDEVIGMQKLSQGEYLLVVSEKGYGKLTAVSEFTVQNRGGKGLRCYRFAEKTGQQLVGFKLCTRDRELMLITTAGIVIRMSLSDVSVTGRSTSGVKFMSVDQDTSIASIAKVRESAQEAEDNEGGAAETENTEL